MERPAASDNLPEKTTLPGRDTALRCLLIPPGRIADSEGLKLCSAGSAYPNFFCRDNMVANFLSPHAPRLGDCLVFLARRSSRIAEPVSGAEPFKIPHEVPGVFLPDQTPEDLARSDRLSTEFAGCDTGAWFMIGHSLYYRVTKDWSLVQAQRELCEGLVDRYVRSHINSDGQFYDDPRQAGADRYALKRTDWRDSALPGRANEEPVFPAVYPLVQALYIRGLRGMAGFSGRTDCASDISGLVDGLEDLFDDTLGGFILAKDALGKIAIAHTDSLSMLAFLNWGDLNPAFIPRIVESSEILETPVGYNSMDPKTETVLKDTYHARVWLFEQALIHLGAARFLQMVQKRGEDYLRLPLKHVLDVSSRITRIMDRDSESVVVNGDQISRVGCASQLWSIFARYYFTRLGYPIGQTGALFTAT